MTRWRKGATVVIDGVPGWYPTYEVLRQELLRRRAKGMRAWVSAIRGAL